MTISLNSKFTFTLPLVERIMNPNEINPRGSKVKVPVVDYDELMKAKISGLKDRLNLK